MSAYQEVDEEDRHHGEEKNPQRKGRHLVVELTLATFVSTLKKQAVVLVLTRSHGENFDNGAFKVGKWGGLCTIRIQP